MRDLVLVRGAVRADAAAEDLERPRPFTEPGGFDDFAGATVCLVGFTDLRSFLEGFVGRVGLVVAFFPGRGREAFFWGFVSACRLDRVGVRDGGVEEARAALFLVGATVVLFGFAGFRSFLEGLVGRLGLVVAFFAGRGREVFFGSFVAACLLDRFGGRDGGVEEARAGLLDVERGDAVVRGLLVAPFVPGGAWRTFGLGEGAATRGFRPLDGELDRLWRGG